MKALNKITLLIIFISLFICSCTSKYEERLEGVWEWVDVTDIYTDRVEEWHFIEYDFMLKQYVKSNPDSIWVYQQGSYYVEWTLFGKYLHISETEIRSYNTKWDIIKLKDDVLIISNDIDGGILYKEFIKIGN